MVSKLLIVVLVYLLTSFMWQSFLVNMLVARLAKVPLEQDMISLNNGNTRSYMRQANNGDYKIHLIAY